MRMSEEIDLREGLVYDPYVKGFDSNFWHGDTANLLFDTVQNAIKIGDTGLVGSMSSYSQYLYGDFEFTIQTDCLSPDSNDSERRWGLINKGDPLTRGAVFFAMEYDTNKDTTVTNQLWCVAIDEYGTQHKTRVAWDSSLGNHANTRYRITWEADGYQFLINDTVVATLPLGGGADSNGNVFRINTTIPQALRISNRSLDTTDTNPMRLMNMTIRNARKVI